MTEFMKPESLSNGDERILNQVFDPESSPETPVVKIDTSLPPDPHIADVNLLQELKAKELEAIRIIENASSKPTLSLTTTTTTTSIEHKDTQRHTAYNNALAILNDLITTNPSYASAYNNRAQLRRWYFANELLTPNDSAAKDLTTVITDLRRAIALASPPSTSNPVSKPQARLLMQAWTQLGAVFWSLGRRRGGASDSTSGSEECGAEQILEVDGAEDWMLWDGHALEEEGSRCFFAAGLYGSDVGRGLAVKTNPYARLCGGIVKEAMRREGGI